jgi:hypothetical protein
MIHTAIQNACAHYDTADYTKEGLSGVKVNVTASTRLGTTLGTGAIDIEYGNGAYANGAKDTLIGIEEVDARLGTDSTYLLEETQVRLGIRFKDDLGTGVPANENAPCDQARVA